MITATAIAPVTTTSASATTRRFPLLKTGAAAGALAAATTTACAVVAHGVGVSFADKTGASIPWFAFAQLTFICALLGVAVAAGVRRRASQPRRTFTRATWSLAAVSCVAPTLVGLSAAGATTLVGLHLVAAAMIIPALSSRLPR